MKLALAGLLLAAVLAPVSPAANLAIPSPFSASFHYVPRVDCGKTRGSAVRISDDVLITATHVIDGGPCSAFGKPLTIAYKDPNLDFAAVTAPLGYGYRAIISCDGIQEGRRYIAMGYPDGEYAAFEPLVGTGDYTSGYAILKGRIFHGMSGGAVADEMGAIVAINNAMPKNGKPLVFVTALKDTYLCA